jgi:predicted glutamine amidotransferase
MCELLGMNCNVPTDIVFSFTGFRRRGGGTGPHTDGWGIAFYDGKGARVFHDVEASANSEIAKLIERFPIKSKNVISHIRKLTRSKAKVENTHPFQRELWGRTFCFAHNGYVRVKHKPLTFYRPVGTTDSEHAFCYLLDVVRRRHKEPPPARVLAQTLRELSDELSELGKFHYLLCDSQRLWAHASHEGRLHFIQRKAPFSQAHLVDAELAVDFQAHTTPKDRVVVVATRPLTANEHWTPLAAGELVVFQEGALKLRLPRGATSSRAPGRPARRRRRAA